MKKIQILSVALAVILSLGCISTFAAETDVQVVCVGDSLTYSGIYDGTTETEHDYYPKKLDELLGEGYAVTGAGLSGATMVDSRAGYIGTPRYKTSISVTPDYVVIMLGTNDINNLNFTQEADTVQKQMYEKNYKRLIDTYRSLNSSVEIIMVAPPPVQPDTGDYNNSRNTELQIVGDFVKELAAKYGCEFFDMYDWIWEKSGNGTNAYFWSDGTHFGANGYDSIAEGIYNKICEMKDTYTITADAIGTNISVISNKEITANMYAAAYDEDNTMLGIKVFENKTLNAYAPFTISELDISGANEVKLFYWNGELTPLADFSVMGERLEGKTIKGISLLGNGRTQGILVTDVDGNVKYAAQQTVADGKYSYDLSGLDAGTYDTYTGTKGTAVKETVKLN